MVKATIFKNNKSQAVRLPKEVAFPESVKQVEVIRQGESLIMTPVDLSWADFFHDPDAAGDCPITREFIPDQEREIVFD